jgi:hypothetical protein
MKDDRALRPNPQEGDPSPFQKIMWTKMKKKNPRKRTQPSDRGRTARTGRRRRQGVLNRARPGKGGRERKRRKRSGPTNAARQDATGASVA